MVGWVRVEPLLPVQVRAVVPVVPLVVVAPTLMVVPTAVEAHAVERHPRWPSSASDGRV